jgi:phosphatidate phosphatase APP1
VTFYPAYGYREGAQQGADWLIRMRTWVHENRDEPIRKLAKAFGRISTEVEALELRLLVFAARLGRVGLELETLKFRLRDFLAHDIHEQQVEIQFDSDPEQTRYQLGTSDHNGLIENELRLSEAKYQQLLTGQGQTKGWLTYHAVSSSLTEKGRIRLIDPDGTSVVTDIDDTIKVSDIPAAKAKVLGNTFWRSFVAAPGMSDMYRTWGDDVPFHYVSGGPWQLYGPLYDYFIGGPGAYPDGSFHFRYLPKNILEEDTREILRRAVADSLFESMFGSLKETYDHKKEEITRLMDNFPARNFILIGDSGEMDPEVYRWFKENPKYSKQVKETWIRDVVNDDKVNPDRLKGMKVIKAEPIICATQRHYKKVAAMIKLLYGSSYKPAPGV